MKYRELKTTVLLVIFLTLFTPFICVGVGTEEYAEQTRKECSQCHVDPSGGAELTAEGKTFAKDLEIKGLYTLTTSKERPIKIVIGFLHMMTAFVWFGSILYIHLFLKPAYVSRGIPKGELKLGWLSMIIMLVTGIFLMRYKVPSLEALFHTRFGILLLIKISLFLLMVLTIFIVTFMIAPKLREKTEGTVKLDKKGLTVDELAQFDGKEGRPAYIAYNENIYDVTSSKLWKEGNHVKKHMAGFDLASALKNAPHGADRLDSMPIVGHLLSSKQKQEKPFFIKLFYFLAYMMLVVIFLVIFIISLWKW
jgi:predicted heme/steroid binding protein